MRKHDNIVMRHDWKHQASCHWTKNQEQLAVYLSFRFEDKLLSHSMKISFISFESEQMVHRDYVGWIEN